MVKRKFSTVYQFKVVLGEIMPPVWRRIQVPEIYTFWDLHVAIQDVMGWQDYHLHEFDIVNPATGTRDRIGIPDEDFVADLQWFAGWELQISAYFSPNNPSAHYTYDFGDNWQHLITLEQILAREPRVRYPRCLGGARACPPEDCGGVFGYGEFLHAIQDPQHEDHDSLLVWAGGVFDPERFHPEDVDFDDPEARWRFAFLGGN